MQDTKRKEQIRRFIEAYAFPVKDFTESDCVARLLTMYEELTK